MSSDLINEAKQLIYKLDKLIEQLCPHIKKGHFVNNDIKYEVCDDCGKILNRLS